jgi:NAD+ kinase
VPVFGVNFGQVGFLATVERDRMREGFELALDGSLDVLRLPAIELEASAGQHTALNDLALHRRVGGRVAEVSYAVGGDEVGSVRCDGLVVATPAGSTGYNLANGGPVMAWGVAGLVVSFIAPHSLSARALVIAPDDVLSVHNSSREALALAVDGRPIGEIAPEEVVHVRFVDAAAALMQVKGSSFYRRLRDKFGALSR